MSTTLDTFFSGLPTPKQSTDTGWRCSKCHKTLEDGEPRYDRMVKEKLEVLCQPCAKKILKPQENMEANL